MTVPTIPPPNRPKSKALAMMQEQTKIGRELSLLLSKDFVKKTYKLFTDNVSDLL